MLKTATIHLVFTDQYIKRKNGTPRLTRKSLISSCCFNFSKKDWKKSDLSTWRGATHKASMSAPGRQNDVTRVTQRVHWLMQVRSKRDQELRWQQKENCTC